jgi:hypothetical protein
MKGGSPMKHLESFCSDKDCIAAGIYKTPQARRHLQRNEGFPAGILIGPNSRRFSIREVNEWLAKRPTGAKQLRVARVIKSKTDELQALIDSQKRKNVGRL